MASVEQDVSDPGSKNSKLQVVFFGSGPVAAKSLELLHKNFDVEAVVTKPKPTHHRGSFPVLDVAEELTLNVHTVTNKKELSELIATKPFTSMVGILIDFGIIVAQDTIDYFEKGIVNSHFSLLPDLRGADPITFSILSGQKKTGVSLMILVEGMDEGPLISCGIHELDGTETAPLLTDRLIGLSDALLTKEVPSYVSGTSIGIPQEKVFEHIPDYPTNTSYSRKLTKQDGLLDFSKPAEVLEREIRAYAEWPKSYTKIADIDVIITKAHVVPSSIGEKPGDIEAVQPEGILMINTSEGYLCVDKLKPAGKKEMTATEFLRGYGNKL